MQEIQGFYHQNEELKKQCIIRHKSIKNIDQLYFYF